MGNLFEFNYRRDALFLNIFPNTIPRALRFHLHLGRRTSRFEVEVRLVGVGRATTSESVEKRRTRVTTRD